MTIEEALKTGKLDSITDVVYKKLNTKVVTETENALLNVENFQDWFRQYRLKPYLKERFPYHADFL